MVKLNPLPLHSASKRRLSSCKTVDYGEPDDSDFFKKMKEKFGRNKKTRTFAIRFQKKRNSSSQTS